jgi:hypothetical protein
MHQIGEQTCSHVEIPIWDRVNDQVAIRSQDELEQQVCAQIMNGVRRQVWDQAWDLVCEQVKEETDGSKRA